MLLLLLLRLLLLRCVLLLLLRMLVCCLLLRRVLLRLRGRGCKRLSKLGGGRLRERRRRVLHEYYGRHIERRERLRQALLRG